MFLTSLEGEKHVTIDVLPADMYVCSTRNLRTIGICMSAHLHTKAHTPWNLLFIHSDLQFHSEVASRLYGLSYNNQSFSLLQGCNFEEGKELLGYHTNIALLIVELSLPSREEELSDETAEHYGIALIRYLREELRNKNARVILTIGSAGEQPDSALLTRYDIHDCIGEGKTNTHQFVPSVLSALKTYRLLSSWLDLESNFEEKVAQRTNNLEQSKKQLELWLEKLEEDHEAGKRIQFKLLPDEKKDVDNYEFSRYLLSSTTLSGDFLDYFKIDDRTIGFYIADVSGHGISSAFITVLLNNFIHNLLRDFRFEKDDTIKKPDKLLQMLNEEFLQEDLEKYLTIFYGIINIESNIISFANGGQFPAPIVYSSTEITMNLLQSWKKQNIPLGTRYSPNTTPMYPSRMNTGRIKVKGKPIGLFHGAYYKTYEMVLPDEFLILMISDGILEVLPHTTLRDKLNYLDTIIDDLDIEIQELMDKLHINNGSMLPDDITFLMIKRRL
jgi:serine phosphatase RsbU (regulator of sigma subunit)